jgi:hypothetical protein
LFQKKELRNFQTQVLDMFVVVDSELASHKTASVFSDIVFILVLLCSVDNDVVKMDLRTVYSKAFSKFRQFFVVFERSSNRVDCFTDANGEDCIFFRGKIPTDEEVEYIAQLLRDKRNLKKLILLFCSISDDHLSVLIGEDIDCFDNLRELRLGSNQITVLGVNTIAKAVTNGFLNNLQVLHLGGNKLRTDGAREISRILVQSKLVHLDLSLNDIEDEGVAYIADSLTSSETLKVLNLEANRITDIGVGFLCAALQVNKQLQSLYLSYNIHISDLGCNKLQLACLGHLSIKEITLDATNVLVRSKERLKRQLIKLHTDQVKLFVALISPSVIKRLHAGKVNISTLPPELIRLVGEMVFDERGTQVGPIPRSNVKIKEYEGFDAFDLFLFTQVLLWFWAIAGLLIARIF